MAWIRYSRKMSGRPSQFMEWVTVFAGGIRFSRPAKDRWLKDNPYVEIFIDQDEHKLAFRTIAEVSIDAYKVSMQGQIKTGRACYYIPCRAAIKAWDREFKGSYHCTLKQLDNGLIQLDLCPLDVEYCNEETIAVLNDSELMRNINNSKNSLEDDLRKGKLHSFENVFDEDEKSSSN